MAMQRGVPAGVYRLQIILILLKGKEKSIFGGEKSGNGDGPIFLISGLFTIFLA